MANALWIWDIVKAEMAALILQKDPIKVVKWDPNQNRLAFCTGNGCIYFWTPAGCSCIQLPHSIGNFKEILLFT